MHKKRPKNIEAFRPSFSGPDLPAGRQARLFLNQVEALVDTKLTHIFWVPGPRYLP